MNAVVKLQNISFRYSDYDQGEVRASDLFIKINITADKGQVLTIMGRSGCGKTTILNLISGLLTPTEGHIWVNAKRLACVFQDNRLIPWLTIGKNVSFGAKEMGISLSSSEVDDLLYNVGLPPKLKDMYPKILSGGMQQRVSLARAIACSPDLLLLDEPFSALDTVTKNDLIHRISNYIKTTQGTVILVTHHLEDACILSNKVYNIQGYPASLDKIINIATPSYQPNDSDINNIKSDIMQKLKEKNLSEFTPMALSSSDDGVEEFITFMTQKEWVISHLKAGDQFPQVPPDAVIVEESFQESAQVVQRYTGHRTRVLWIKSIPQNIDAQKVSKISGDFEQLKNWWGWENIYDDLIQDAPKTKIKDILIGHNWTFVETKYGGGLSRTPCRGTEGGRTLENAGDFIGKTVKEMSQWLKSDDDLARSVAIASLSSYYNNQAKGIIGETTWGFRVFKECIGKKVCVGNFPPAPKIIPDIKIIEREPKENHYTVDEGEVLLQEADYVVITSQTLMNGSLPRLLFLAQKAQVMLLGPTTILSPVWKKYGVHYICGVHVTHAKEMKNFTSQAGAMLLKDHMSEKMTIAF